MNILKTSAIDTFQCLGPECPDTCCTRYTVAVDEPTFNKYKTKAPELLDFIVERPGVGKVLKFDAQTGNCPKLSCGACSIHANYGTDFLTDTCHLYPRITRALGDTLTMSGSLSCPEVARLALKVQGADFVDGLTDRIPTSLKNYLPEGWNPDAAIGLHKRIISLAEQSLSSEQFLAKFMYFSMRFKDSAYPEWDAALDASWRVMDVLLPKPQKNAQNPLYLLIIFSTILSALKLTSYPRLDAVLEVVRGSVSCKIGADANALETTPQTMHAINHIEQQWQLNYAAKLEPVLKQLLIAKLSSSLFPFAGLGEDPAQKILWLGVQFALMRFCIAAYASVHAAVPDEPTIIQIIQPMTRVLDHLPNLDLAMPMLREAGYHQLERFSGMLLY